MDLLQAKWWEESFTHFRLHLRTGSDRWLGLVWHKAMFHFGFGSSKLMNAGIRKYLSGKFNSYRNCISHWRKFLFSQKKKTFVTNFSAYGLVHVTFFIALDNFFHWNRNLSVSECCWLLAVESPCSGDSRWICLHFHLYSPLAIAQAFLHNFKNLSHFHVANDRIHYTMQRFF